MQQAGFISAEDGTLGSIVEALGVGARFGERSKCAFITSWDEFGITEALIVTTVAKELSGVL